MHGSTHLAAGLAVAALGYHFTPLLREGTALPLLPALQIGPLATPQLFIPLEAAVCIVGIVGGLVADIDHPESTIANAPAKLATPWGRRLARAAFRRKRGVGEALWGFVQLLGAGLIWFFSTLLNLITRSVAGLIRAVTGHRGITHWAITALVSTVLVTGAVYVIWPGRAALGLLFGLAYASHLLLDLLTVSGIKVWSPLFDNTVRLLPKAFCVNLHRPGGRLVSNLLTGCCWVIVVVIWWGR